MERYKKILIIRIVLLSALALLAVGIELFDVFWAQEHLDSITFCFQCGLACAIGILSVILIIRYGRILHDESKLQIEYNKEHDERMRAIRSKAGVPIIPIISVVIMIIGIIVGYFNVTVFYTLIAVSVGQLVIALIVKLVYMKIL